MQQRGSKYDARTKEQALALIASGVSITNAAKQLQIPKSTVAGLVEHPGRRGRGRGCGPAGGAARVHPQVRQDRGQGPGGA